jgi:hypothetical protein
MRGLPLAVAAAALALARTVTAQPIPSFDHLQCFEITDSTARDTASADLVPEHGPPFPITQRCKIRFPAKYFCTDVSKQNVQPPPTGSQGRGDVGEYFCYRLACPRETAPERGSTIAAADQFGARVIKLARRSPLLCVPAIRSVPPTPTPAVTPTPSSDVFTPSPSPSPTADPDCFFDGAECRGPCSTSGRCLFDPAQNRCVCPAAFDMDCNQFGVFAQCPSGLLCPAPGQVCVLVDPPECRCVSPTPQPTP